MKGNSMGMWNLFDKTRRAKQARLAAEQIYQALLTHSKLEVKLEHSTDEITSQSILFLRKKYPHVSVMYQAKTVILTLTQTAKASMSNQAWGILDANGYFPANDLPAQFLFDFHRAFMSRNDVNPDEAMSEARAAREKDVALT